MNQTEIEQFRNALLSLRSELQNLEKSSKEAAEPDQAALDLLSRLDAMQAQQLVEEPVRRRKRQLGKLRAHSAVLKPVSTATALCAAKKLIFTRF